MKNEKDNLEINPASTDINPYEVLGLESNASKDELKRAYNELSKEFHPDTRGCDEKYNRIFWAYSILSNEHWKKQYDRSIGVGEHPEDLKDTPQDFLKFMIVVLSFMAILIALA